MGVQSGSGVDWRAAEARYRCFILAGRHGIAVQS